MHMCFWCFSIYYTTYIINPSQAHTLVAYILCSHQNQLIYIYLLISFKQMSTAHSWWLLMFYACRISFLHVFRHDCMYNAMHTCSHERLFMCGLWSSAPRYFYFAARSASVTTDFLHGCLPSYIPWLHLSLFLSFSQAEGQWRHGTLQTCQTENEGTETWSTTWLLHPPTTAHSTTQRHMWVQTCETLHTQSQNSYWPSKLTCTRMFWFISMFLQDKLMSECAGSIDSIKRVKLILDEEELDDHGLTASSATDRTGNTYCLHHVHPH